MLEEQAGRLGARVRTGIMPRLFLVYMRIPVGTERGRAEWQYGMSLCDDFRGSKVTGTTIYIYNRRSHF
jgi:hypothetical protein